MTPDQIRAALADRKIRSVARATGLSRGTIYRFMRGDKDPHPSTLVLLEAYLKGAARG